MPGSKPSNTEDLTKGILSGDRIVLAKAITLVESSRKEDQALAHDLLNAILHKTGNGIRIGITGPPGVGKSSFIEVFGKHLTKQNLRIAVLTVDPSSQRTQGSILGDKTRMQELSKDPNAFIRPSASGNILGGVAQKTREAMLLCEAAGYDVIIIETVGVGQSEVSIKNMIDFFLLLSLAGAGDELQGIKKGIIEVADTIVITKADGDNVLAAGRAQTELQHALHLVHKTESPWTPRVLTASSVSGKGIDEIWKTIQEFKSATESTGEFSEIRKQQKIQWMTEYFQQLLQQDLDRTELKQLRSELQQYVSKDEVSPYVAATELLKKYHDIVSGKKS